MIDVAFAHKRRPMINTHLQAHMPWNTEQDTLPLPARSRRAESQIAVQPDYSMMRTLSELSGLRLLVVYRLLRGQQVSDAHAWERLLNARLEMQRREQARHLRKQVFHE